MKLISLALEEKPPTIDVRRNKRILCGFVTAMVEKAEASGYRGENIGFTWKCVQPHHLIGIRFLGKSFNFRSLSLICEMGIISPPTWQSLNEN